MVSAEAALNTNIPFQTDIEQALVGTEREGTQKEFQSLSSFLVAAEAGADSSLQVGIADNEAATRSIKPAESHKVVAGLTAAALAITGMFAPTVSASTKIFSGAERSIVTAKVKRMQKRAKAGIAVGGHDRGTDGHGDVLKQEVVDVNGEKCARYTLTLNHFKTIVGGQAIVKTVDGSEYFVTMYRSKSKPNTYTYTDKLDGLLAANGMDVFLR